MKYHWIKSACYRNIFQKIGTSSVQTALYVKIFQEEGGSKSTITQPVSYTCGEFTTRKLNWGVEQVKGQSESESDDFNNEA